MGVKIWYRCNYSKNVNLKIFPKYPIFCCRNSDLECQLPFWLWHHCVNVLESKFHVVRNKLSEVEINQKMCPKDTMMWRRKTKWWQIHSFCLLPNPYQLETEIQHSVYTSYTYMSFKKCLVTMTWLTLVLTTTEPIFFFFWV